MEYKIGDKVRVREDLVVDQQYGKYIFSHSMTPFKGKIVTISKVTSSKYEIKGDPRSFWWTEEMFSEKVSKDFIPEEFVSQNTIPEEEKSSNIITVKTTKLKLLL